MTDIEGDQESINGYTSTRVGPQPEEVAPVATAEELDNLGDYLRKWKGEGVPLETVGILARSKFQIGKVNNALNERDLEARTAGAATMPGVPSGVTMQRTRGMEFTRVLLFGISDQTLLAS